MTVLSSFRQLLEISLFQEILGDHIFRIFFIPSSFYCSTATSITKCLVLHIVDSISGGFIAHKLVCGGNDSLDDHKKLKFRVVNYVLLKTGSPSFLFLFLAFTILHKLHDTKIPASYSFGIYI